MRCRSLSCEELGNANGARLGSSRTQSFYFKTERVSRMEAPTRV